MENLAYQFPKVSWKKGGGTPTTPRSSIYNDLQGIPLPIYLYLLLCHCFELASLGLLIISIFCFHLLKEFEDKKSDDLKLEEKSDKADSGMDEDSQPYNALGNCASYDFVSTSQLLTTYQEHSLLFPIFFFFFFLASDQIFISIKLE